MIYRNITPGPPKKQAFPIALNVPPPIMAAIPKKVKSFTFKTLFNSVCSKSLPDFTKREIAFLAQNEKTIHLDDLLLRRTMIAILGRATKESVQEIADVMGGALGWNEEQKNAEVSRTVRLLSGRHRVRL